MDSEQTNVGLEQILGVTRRRAAWVVLCVVLVAGAAYAFSERQTKQYVATASLAFNNNELSQQVAGLGSGATSESQLAQERTNVKLLQLGDLAAKTATRLGKGLTIKQVSEDVSITPEGESNIVNVTATAPSPTLAADIANAYSELFVSAQRDSNRKYYSAALAVVNKHLAALSPHERYSPAGLALQDRAQALAVLAELQSGTIQVAQAATAPTSPSSPKVSRNTLLGAVLGLLLGLGVAFLLERFDRRIREPEDLSRIYRRPLLGVLPQSKDIAGASQRRERGDRTLLPPHEAEVFQLIRARLRYFNADRELRTLLVTSAAPGDGKTTVSRYLAVAAASMGATVLLLEADLRRPNIAEQLDIDLGPGLSDVLIGSVSLRRATQPVAIDPPPGGLEPLELDVLVAGTQPPPNPAELIGSDSMAMVMKQLREMYHLVVIDTSPLNVVSDAFPLLREVDGVVVVGWVGRDHRAVAEHLRDTLEGVGAPLVGVIANGYNANRPTPYSYDGEYTASSPRMAEANGYAGPDRSLSHLHDYVEAGSNGASAPAPNGTSRTRGPAPSGRA